MSFLNPNYKYTAALPMAVGPKYMKPAKRDMEKVAQKQMEYEAYQMKKQYEKQTQGLSQFDKEQYGRCLTSIPKAQLVDLVSNHYGLVPKDAAQKATKLQLCELIREKTLLGTLRFL